MNPRFHGKRGLMIRNFYLTEIYKQFNVHPICAILGARQVGKTTLARQFVSQEKNIRAEFFDLENPMHLASLQNPMLTLSKYHDYLIVIDEIQLKPDIFPILRVLVDDPDKKYRFLILGSASQELINKSSETLAGRIGYIYLPGFNLKDVADSQKLLMRGGFPRSYLANSDEDSFTWREGYIITFLQKDLPSFGFDISPQVMHKFWMMLCFYHGQIFNAQDMASSLMLSDKTIRKYLDILASTFMIRILYPWFENIKKRQTKTPKIYFKDSGIFNTLSSIHSITQLAKNPKIGPVWEGFALEQIINYFQVKDTECFFWATHNQAELDLLIFKNNKKIGFEFKYSDSPKTTKSMHIALEDLQLDHLYIIFPSDRIFDLTDKITACGLDAISKIQL
jgi:predicted AAA+ superfamily ATPase